MNRSSVGTLVERTSRYVKLDGGCAPDVLAGFKRRMKSIPPSLRKTMTYDQGLEMALHETLSAEVNMDTEEIGPRMLAQIAKHTGPQPEDL